MIIQGLIKEVSNICLSYLSDEERIYIKKEWENFDKIVICKIAARNGWLDLLIWARQNGCEWDSWTCTYAAGNGHLEVLKWTRLNNCPWNERTCKFAAERNYTEIIEWLSKNNCPCKGKYHKIA